MREIVHLQAGQCGNQIGAKVSYDFNMLNLLVCFLKGHNRYDKNVCLNFIYGPSFNAHCTWIFMLWSEHCKNLDGAKSMIESELGQAM